MIKLTSLLKQQLLTQSQFASTYWYSIWKLAVYNASKKYKLNNVKAKSIIKKVPSSDLVSWMSSTKDNKKKVIGNASYYSIVIDGKEYGHFAVILVRTEDNEYYVFSNAFKLSDPSYSRDGIILSTDNSKVTRNFSDPEVMKAFQYQAWLFIDEYLKKKEVKKANK